MDDKIVLSYCRSCNQTTKHFVKANYDVNNGEYLDNHPDEITDMYVYNYLILECCGCTTISFRQVEKVFACEGKDEEGSRHFNTHSELDIIYPSTANLGINPKQIQGVPKICIMDKPSSEN